MYDYNTSREPLKLRQFGRNIQNLVSYVSGLESKEDRTRYAEALIEMMKQVVPSAKANQESNQLLWDDLFILADFDIDIDSPFPMPEEKLLSRKPDVVGYSTGNIRFRHYGRNVDLLVAEAIKIEDPEEKEAAIFHIARLIKSFHVTWNKETPDNELIEKNIGLMSDGALKLNLDKAIDLDLLEPLYKDKPKPVVQNGRKSTGKSQNRRRRK